MTMRGSWFLVFGLGFFRFNWSTWSLCNNINISSLAERASHNISFLYKTRDYFSSSHILTLHKSQNCPSIGYSSHIWETSLSHSLSLKQVKSRLKQRIFLLLTTLTNWETYELFRTVDFGKEDVKHSIIAVFSAFNNRYSLPQFYVESTSFVYALT